jgi:hypothetical protein
MLSSMAPIRSVWELPWNLILCQGLSK